MKQLLLFLFLSLGLSPAIARTTLHKPTATGKDYYIVFPKSAWGNQSVGVLINSPTKQKITVTSPTGSKSYVDIKKAKTTQYYPGQFRTESTPGLRKKEAARIQAPNPITVHGQFGLQGISGTFTAIPVTAWGNEYYAVAPPEGTNSGYYYYPTIFSVPMIDIIASRAGTTVEITPTANTSMGQAAGVKFTITLGNAGDVYHLSTTGDPQAGQFHFEDNCQADLSGTHIQSSSPVGVIVAQSHSTWPCGDNECGDYCVEMLPPVCNWDSLYVITPSFPRVGGAVGEALRIVFSQNGTDLIVDDGRSAPRTVGTFAAGDSYDYPASIGDAIVLSGTHPFLVVEITRKPANCFVGNSGGENWTLGMVVITGVNQWSDYTPFSTAITSASSIANVFFRYADRDRIRLSGKLLTQTNPVVKILPQGFATMNITINAAEYNELTCDSGATAGGSIFGYGTLRFSPIDDSAQRTARDPEVIKSFCHPIGINALPACNPDATAPHMTLTYNCSTWSAVALDDELEPPASGVFDIYLKNDGVDSSFNVILNPAPNYALGDSRVSFGIYVNSVIDTARAHVFVRDGAGNEYDTVLLYFPQKLTAQPRVIDVGAVHVGECDTVTMVVKNESLAPASFERDRLRFGLSHHWEILRPPTPTPLFTIMPGDSVRYTFRYCAPDTKGVEFDDDTLFVTTCREFPIATLLGKPKRPGIFTSCHDFGSVVIDTLFYGGDTSVDLRSTWVASIGDDTLHVSGITLTGGALNEPAFPQSDFAAGPIYTTARTGDTLPEPTAQAPWAIAPGDTVFVEVRAHPHHSLRRHATLTFLNDANGALLDTACLDMFGVRPAIIANSVDYGSHLYATTADSFFTVRNTGTTNLTLNHRGFLIDSTYPDWSSFVLRNQQSIVDPGGIIYFDSTTEQELDTAGFNQDVLRVPYRFLGRKLGANVMRMTIKNSGPLYPAVVLKGTVVQPHLTAACACPPDSLPVPSTQSIVVKMWNNGTDSMHIENLDVGGERADEWIIARVDVRELGVAVTTPPWSFPLPASAAFAPRDTAFVTLTWTTGSSTLPSTQIHAVGIDRLGRHAADSASGTIYPWSVFPYDTTMPIFNGPCITGVDDRGDLTPSQSILWPNYPNPFTSSTTLTYTIGSPGVTTIRVRNVLGEIVQTAVHTYRGVGTYSLQFNSGGLPAGVYFCEMMTNANCVVREMAILH